MAGSSGGGIPWKPILIVIVVVFLGYASPTHNAFGAIQSVATFLQSVSAGYQ